MSQQYYGAKSTILSSGKNRLEAYAFQNKNSRRVDDISLRPLASADTTIVSRPQRSSASSTSKSSMGPVIFKVDSVTSSLSAPSATSDMLIRPPSAAAKTRGGSKPRKTKKKHHGVEDDRNDENPIIRLQKLMSSKEQQNTWHSSRMDPSSPAATAALPPLEQQQQQQQTPPPSYRGSFADIDIRAKRRGVDRPRMEERQQQPKQEPPPVYQTIIADTRYPKPQDTLDDVFNVMEHAICPSPQPFSRKKDMLDTFCGAAEHVICGPDPRYAYQQYPEELQQKKKQQEEQKEQQRRILFEQAIRDKHVLTNYPSIIEEGARSPNYNLVVSAAEAAAQLQMDAPPTIRPPSAKLLQLPQSQQQPENHDLLDVICSQVEAVTCDPRRQQEQLLLAAAQQNKLLPDRDVLDVICQGLEHELCGGGGNGGGTRSLAPEEMITFDDPEEKKRQALQKLFKPPTRKAKDHQQVSPITTTINPPALKNHRRTTKTSALLQQQQQVKSDTITPPALQRKKKHIESSRRGDTTTRYNRLEERRKVESSLYRIGRDGKKIMMGAAQNGSPQENEERIEDPRPSWQKKVYKDHIMLEPKKKLFESSREKRAKSREPPSAAAVGTNSSIRPPSMRTRRSGRPTEDAPVLPEEGEDVGNAFYWEPNSS